MDHSEAVRTRAAERYLLNELTGEECSAFEEHYFSCADCAEEVRCGATLIENLREIVGNTSVAALSAPRIAARRGFRFLSPAYAAAAIVLLAALVGYQSLVTIPRLRREASIAVPQVLTSVSLMPSVSRGDSLPAVKVRSNEPFGLYLDIPPQSGFAAFLGEFRSGSKVEFTVHISDKQASDTVHLLVPGGKLTPGRYDLVVSGISPNATPPHRGPEIIRYSFQVEHQQ